MEQLQNANDSFVSQTQVRGWESTSAAEHNGVFCLKIAQLLRKIWIKRKLFVCLVVSGIILSLVWAMTRPVVYRSTTTLMPPDNSSSSSGIGGMLTASMPTSGSSLLSVKTPGALFIAILGSRAVLDRLVVRFDLVEKYKSQTIEGASQELAKNTKLIDNPRSGIVTITVEDNNALLASQIANGYVEELNRVVTENHTSSARRERVFLEERLKQIKQDLDSAANTLSQFSVRSRTIDLSSQGITTLNYEAKLRTDLEGARAELAALEQVYSPGNVRIHSVKARIAEFERQINTTRGNPEKVKSNSTDALYPSISELPGIGVTYTDLQRTLREKEGIWDMLTRQYESAKVQEAKEIPSVRVLDIANVPQRRSSPARTSIMVVGTMISLMVATILVLALSEWESMDNTEEPKILVRDVLNSTLNSHKWRRLLLGINRISSRKNKLI